MSERLALAGRIRLALEDIAAAINHAARLAEKARKSGDDDYWGGFRRFSGKKPLDIFPPLHIITSNAQRQVVEQLFRKPPGDARRPARKRNPLCLTPSQGTQNKFCST